MVSFRVPSHGMFTCRVPSHGIVTCRVPSHGMFTYRVPSYGMVTCRVPNRGMVTGQVPIVTGWLLPFPPEVLLDLRATGCVSGEYMIYKKTNQPKYCCCQQNIFRPLGRALHNVKQSFECLKTLERVR